MKKSNSVANLLKRMECLFLAGVLIVLCTALLVSCGDGEQIRRETGKTQETIASVAWPSDTGVSEQNTGTDAGTETTVETETNHTEQVTKEEDYIGTNEDESKGMGDPHKYI